MVTATPVRATETTGHLVEEIQRLRTAKQAVILAHNYQIGPIQDLANVVGDSLGLAQAAAQTDAAVIVMCRLQETT